MDGGETDGARDPGATDGARESGAGEADDVLEAGAEETSESNESGTGATGVGQESDAPGATGDDLESAVQYVAGDDRESNDPGATGDDPGVLAGGRRFDWVMVGLSAWWLVGIYLDGRAHAHDAPDSVVTPEHAVFYAAFLAILAWLGAAVYDNRSRHGSSGVRAALPTGYWPAFLGAVAFAVGGAGDLAWHAAFGIEAGLEALVSPTHLLMATGGVLMASGPLRAAWYRATPPTWRAQAPMVLSATVVLAVLTFVTTFLNPFVYARALVPGSPESLVVQAGVAGVLAHSTLVMAVVLALARRFDLVFGTVTVLVGGNALAASPLGNSYPLVPVAVVAGLGADLLYAWLRPAPDRPRAFRTFALAVPVVVYGLYFLAIEYAVGIGWSVHFWTGTVALAGLAGLGLSYLAVPPDPGLEPGS